jgi:hydrogenase maturation protein HypF
MIGEQIRVRGRVQGVGFRPTVYRLAKACGLRGDVCNDGEGVLIRAFGSEDALTKFVQRLYEECPPLAKISEVTRQRYDGKCNFDDFVISASLNNFIKTEIAPDAATCPQCQQEIFNPYSRYYRYPFTNCTHCGPRLSIIRGIPYDRGNTSMSGFGMCPQCGKEYNDVDNRRFHAQAIACHICGPDTWLQRADSKPITSFMFSMLDEVDAVCTLLQKGEIVAIKGIGGIHLACDATNESAVQKLRFRKHRDHKPFALMARDIKVIEQYCIINPKERELLESPAAPIVLLEKSNIDSIALSVAPKQNTLGFMLPYTPLHHLILKRMNRPIVLTSGNISDEPQCIDNQEGQEKLREIADYFLLHNREILNRVDDSVVRVIDDRLQIIRRARGYAPAPINLPLGFDKAPHILAMGGELKNTFCLLQDGKAILSQHLGDLENAITFNAYQDTVDLYLNLFQHKPQIIAVDKHPEYLSTKLGQQIATTTDIKLDNIQHHHAHIAACMAENGIAINTSPVLGIALDGLGYGEDNTFWGGEFLLTDYCNFQRLATFKPVAMIGGKQAIYQPWRNTYSHLLSAFSWKNLTTKYSDLELIKFLETKPLKLLNQLINQNINTPLASSVGRLFDAVAAAIGVCRQECSYEGQAAIEMEALIDRDILIKDKEIQAYPFNFTTLENIYFIETSPMWQALLNDLQHHQSQQIIAVKFHRGLANAIINMVKYLCIKHKVNQIVLTGGVFQNTFLLQAVTTNLQSLELKVLTHSIVPPNDGGLSLGQAVITAAKSLTT